MESPIVLRRQIESNSPDLDKLKIGPGDFLPEDGDWASLGRDIGRNTHLKDITVHISTGGVISDGDVAQFFRGVASNRSIQTIRFQPDAFGKVVKDGDAFDILTPFFKSNRNFKRLTIDGLKDQSHPLPQVVPPLPSSVLVDVVSGHHGDQPISVAGDVVVHDHESDGASGEGEGGRGASKAGHPVRGERQRARPTVVRGPRALDVARDPAGEGPPPSAAGGLVRADAPAGGGGTPAGGGGNDASKLPPAVADGASVDPAGATAETSAGGGAGAGSRSLKDVFLHSTSMSDRGWQAITTALQDPTCSLEKLSCQSCITDTSLGSLSITLPNQQSLKSLSLRNNGNVTFNGWRVLFGFLASQNNRLEELDLSNNALNNDAIALLGASLAQNSTLKHLDLSHKSSTFNLAVLSTSLSPILANPSSALVRLDLHCNIFAHLDERNEALTSFATSLVNNACLEELILDYDHSFGWQYYTTQTWDILSKVLWDKSSILATHDSNHTLRNLGKRGAHRGFEHLNGSVPDNIESLLHLNNKSNSQASRRKIIDTHFSGGYNVHPFIEIDPKILPQAITWMGREGGNDDFSRMYQFVKYTAVMRNIMSA